jgi:hypothetical protein
MGRGVIKVIMHPHPSPLPSRERGNWSESMSIFGCLKNVDYLIKRDIKYW